MLCIDCYTLIERRDKQTALVFLDTFVPERRSHLGDHHLPRDADPAKVGSSSESCGLGKEGVERGHVQIPAFRPVLGHTQ